MLSPIKRHLENPENIPQVTPVVLEYLQVQFNAGYAMQIGTVASLKAEGYSESFIAGFLAGLQYASQTLDDMEYAIQEAD